MKHSCIRRSRGRPAPAAPEGPASITAAHERGNPSRRAAALAPEIAFAIALAWAFVGAASAESGVSFSPGGEGDRGLDARSLIGKERPLYFAVSKDEASSAILLKARYETAIAAGLDEVIAVLRDFEKSPETFSRIDSIDLISNDGVEAITDQTTAIRVLGISYVSVARFRSRIDRLSPTEAFISFESIRTDSKLIKSTGSWRLRELLNGNSVLTHVDYRLETLVPARVIGQEFVMRSFGGADVARTLRELSAAVARRTRR